MPPTNELGQSKGPLVPAGAGVGVGGETRFSVGQPTDRRANFQVYDPGRVEPMLTGATGTARERDYEAPVGGTIGRPQRRGLSVLQKFVIGTIAAGTMAAGVGYVALGQRATTGGEQPHPTNPVIGVGPTPRETATPVPAQTESPRPTATIQSAEPTKTATATFSPSATVEITPTPAPTKAPEKPDMTKWYNMIPSNPYKNVDQVPIAKDSYGFKVEGDMTIMEPSIDGYGLRASGLTILSATPDKKNNRIIVTATTGVSKRTETNCNTKNPTRIKVCTESGGEYTLIIMDGAGIMDGNNVLGTSLKDVAPFLKAGSSIRATIVLDNSPLTDDLNNRKGKKIFNSSVFEQNKNSWKRYLDKKGQKVPARRPSGFIWTVAIIDVNTTP